MTKEQFQAILNAALAVFDYKQAQAPRIEIVPLKGTFMALCVAIDCQSIAVGRDYSASRLHFIAQLTDELNDWHKTEHCYSWRKTTTPYSPHFFNRAPTPERAPSPEPAQWVELSGNCG